MLTYICLQYRVATELPLRHNMVYGAEEKGNSFVISPSLRLSTPDYLACAIKIFRLYLFKPVICKIDSLRLLYLLLYGILQQYLLLYKIYCGAL